MARKRKRLGLELYYDGTDATIYLGECSEVMRGLPTSSVDTIITDPPYALEFMGKSWDKVLPSVEVWEQALRVAKPGAIMLAFGGTRTYHRLVVGIEDAGWEIRDCVMWLYGSGFPKSHDISKAIDKAAGVAFDARLASGVGFMNPDGRGGYHVTKNRMKRAGDSTDAAKLWDGWGTALKPAYEPIVVAMKPLDGTFAENAQKHGVAGVWIDGGRVGTTGGTESVGAPNLKNQVYGHAMGGLGVVDGGKGRWPANVIHDGSDEVVAGFLQSSAGVESQPRGTGGIWSEESNRPCGPQYGDAGSAARFFYCAKASASERGKYNDHPTVKPIALLRYLCRLTRTPTGGVVLDPFCGSGSTLLAAKKEDRKSIGIDKDEACCSMAMTRGG